MSALQAGVGGMIAEQTRMDAVGNNIANSNTVGYKSADVIFADALYDVLKPATGPSGQISGTDPVAVGQGVLVTGMNTDFAQGNLMSTGRSTDVAVQGEGFLTLTDGQHLYYTRSGSLGLDANGYLVQLASGLRVLGMPPSAPPGTTGPSVPAGSPAPATSATSVSVSPSNTLQVPIGQTASAHATSQVTLGGNLNSQAASSAKIQVTSHVYDSLGAGHDLTLIFTRSGTAGQWDVSATSPDGTATLASPTQLTFDANGAASPGSLSLQLALSGSSGAGTPQAITVSVANLTQLAQDSSAALRSQDGLPPGTLTGVSIAGDGTIMGIFSNGMSKPLGQLVTTTFSNNNGLESVRDSLYRASLSSGTPVYGAAGSAGHGSIQSGQLESSNVNLTQEFANMLVTQRGYQASSRVVTTADQMLQDLMNVIR
jgi:flagellar hook protein FlgE